MSRLWRGAFLCAAAIVVLGALADDLAARGGRGGGARGGGGISRGGGGVRRGGVAAGGSLGQNRARRDAGSRRYNSRGRAANGDLGSRYPRGEWEGNRQERVERRDERQDERTERREDWQENAEERREDWQEYAEDHYEDHYDDHDGGYYGGYYYGGTYYEDDYVGDYAPEEEYYYNLPCSPVVMSTGGTVYYVCHPDWYIRAYVDGELVYVPVPNPREQ